MSQQNQKIKSYIFQLYSSKGLVFQSPFYTNLDTLKIEAFKKIISYKDRLTLDVIRYD